MRKRFTMSRTEGFLAASAVLPSAWPRLSSANGSITRARSNPGAPAQMNACRQPHVSAMGPPIKKPSAAPTLDRANVAVYPVRQPGSLAPGAADTLGPGLAGAPTLGAGLASTETLEEFAGLTGGRAYGTVDIPGAIAQAASDARMSYLMAYAPLLEKWDGKYHKIRVTCSRKGVRLKTKEGYYAFAGDAHPGDQEKAAFETMVSSPFDVPEIGICGRLAPIGKTPGEVNLEVRIDAADVQLAREGDLSTGQLAVAAAAYQADGRVDLTAAGTLTLRLSPEQREQAMTQGFPLVRLTTLPPTIRKIRLMVYDRASGAIGSLTLPVPHTTPKP